QAEDGIRDRNVTGVQTCALPISPRPRVAPRGPPPRPRGRRRRRGRRPPPPGGRGGSRARCGSRPGPFRRRRPRPPSPAPGARPGAAVGLLRSGSCVLACCVYVAQALAAGALGERFGLVAVQEWHLTMWHVGSRASDDVGDYPSHVGVVVDGVVLVA